MRVNRRFLYAGVFLLAIGGVIVAADLGAFDTATLTDTVRLWPLAVVAVGVGLAFRRTQFSLASGMLAAAVPGVVLGGAFAVAPRFAGDCGARGDPATVASEQGSFDRAAVISVSSGCGSLVLNTAPGSGWQLQAANTAGRRPTVQSTATSLSIDSSGDQGRHLLDAGRDTWALTIPTSDLDRLSLVSHAGRSRANLAGARIGRLVLTANASEILVDASEASVANLSGAVNVGLLSVHLPAAGDLVGSLRVGGGELQLCSPPGLGLRLTSRGSPRQITVGGLEHDESDWQSADFASAEHRADLHVTANFGAVNINPIGGCR